MFEYLMQPITESDANEIIGLFNYYIENSNGTFPDKPVPVSFFSYISQLIHTYPTVSVRDKSGFFIGFGMLRPLSAFPAFNITTVISYFIHPDYTNKGIGKEMLKYLENEAKSKGISSILAEISSLNPGSIKFHEKNGFSHCGRFKKVGLKNGNFFDTIWMQKEI